MLKFDLQKPNDVVAFGRATIDLYANEIGPMEAAKTFSKYVGGSPANTAVAMARLGLEVGYIGKVSDDSSDASSSDIWLTRGWIPPTSRQPPLASVPV